MVMLSVFELPLSEAASRSGAGGVSGALAGQRPRLSGRAEGGVKDCLACRILRAAALIRIANGRNLRPQCSIRNGAD